MRAEDGMDWYGPEDDLGPLVDAGLDTVVVKANMATAEVRDVDGTVIAMLEGFNGFVPIATRVREFRPVGAKVTRE